MKYFFYIYLLLTFEYIFLFYSEDKDDEGFEHGYRDRALERRKEINTEDAQMEEIVSKLDVQQTKYLGGKY